MNDICMNHEERYWQTLTTSANTFFTNGNFEKALSLYKKALYRAEILNNHLLDCKRLNIPFMQVYIISCNNLANTYEELGNITEAENLSKRNIYYLLHLASNKSLDINEIQTELKRASLHYVELAERINSGNIQQEQFFKTIKEQLIENNFYYK